MLWSNNLEIGSLRFDLGEPEDKSIGIKKIIIEKYHEGSLEITVRNGLIILIAIYLNKGILKNNKNQREYHLDLPSEVFTDSLLFVSWFDTYNATYKVKSDDLAYKMIELERGVTIIFLQNCLYSIQTSLKE